jgi:hypothetical protein
MSAQHDDLEEAIGSDSFLDIASNIVGVLIILVLVGATRLPTYVREAVRESRTEKKEKPAADAPKQDLSAARDRAQRIAHDLNQMANEAGRLGQEIQAAKYARERIEVAIKLAEHELAEQRKKLGDRERKAHELGQKLVSAKLRLDEVQREKLSLVSAPPEDINVVSYPSAISKTVFTREEHYRLMGGKLVRVPFEELTEELIESRRQLLWKLEDMPEVSGTVGPIAGFRLDYHFVRTATGGVMSPSFFVPVQADLGEPLSMALAAGSPFRQKLAGLDRQNTTITIWTYPDSFDEFRQLKKELYQMGFSVAGRPLEADARIGISSSGSKSSAQ